MTYYTNNSINITNFYRSGGDTTLSSYYGNIGNYQSSSSATFFTQTFTPGFTITGSNPTYCAVFDAWGSGAANDTRGTSNAPLACGSAASGTNKPIPSWCTYLYVMIFAAGAGGAGGGAGSCGAPGGMASYAIPVTGGSTFSYYIAGGGGGGGSTTPGAGGVGGGGGWPGQNGQYAGAGASGRPAYTTSGAYISYGGVNYGLQGAGPGQGAYTGSYGTQDALITASYLVDYNLGTLSTTTWNSRAVTSGIYNIINSGNSAYANKYNIFPVISQAYTSYSSSGQGGITNERGGGGGPGSIWVAYMK